MPTRDEMMKRQHVLADFGEFALRSDDLQEVLTEACRLVGEALGTDLAKIMQIAHEENALLVRAGVGWPEGVVGEVRLPMGERSSETFAIREGKPVITQDIETEDRFGFPGFLKAAGVVSIVNVPIILPGGEPYGLLQVDSRERAGFAEDDIQFLRTYAPILGPVIDRLFKVHDLQVALDRNERLMAELQHRIKNNIGTIMSIVRLRQRDASSAEVREEMRAVGDRIDTLHLIHKQIYEAHAVDHIALRRYLTALGDNLLHMHDAQARGVRFEAEVPEIDCRAEIASPLGLILNEFATNSLKYAFNGSGGVIGLRGEHHEDGRLELRFWDDGRGLPEAPEDAASDTGSGTGMSLIDALAAQVKAEAEWSSDEGGTKLALRLPRC